MFYHLLKGGDIEMLKSIYLANNKGERMSKDDFGYLKEGCDDIPLDRINDVELYNDLVAKFSGELRFSSEEQVTMWKIVAAVLHIGNLDFDLDTYDIITSKH